MLGWTIKHFGHRNQDSTIKQWKFEMFSHSNMMINGWVSEKIYSVYSNPSFSHPNIRGGYSGYFRFLFSLQPILSVVVDNIKWEGCYGELQSEWYFIYYWYHILLISDTYIYIILFYIISYYIILYHIIFILYLYHILYYIYIIYYIILYIISYYILYQIVNYILYYIYYILYTIYYISYVIYYILIIIYYIYSILYIILYILYYIYYIIYIILYIKLYIILFKI